LSELADELWSIESSPARNSDYSAAYRGTTNIQGSLQTDSTCLGALTPSDKDYVFKKSCKALTEGAFATEHATAKLCDIDPSLAL